MSKAQTSVVAQQDNLQSKALAIQAEAQERAAALKELGVTGADIVIPSIQVMQNTSGLVGDGKAKLGDIVNMATEEVLLNPVSILPLKFWKTLRTYEVGGKTAFKFLREDPLNDANSKLPHEGFEEVEGGKVPVKRYVTFNFFVLLKNDMEKDEGFPCLIRFKSTGMNAGKALATHLYKKVFFKKKPYSEFVELTTKKEKKDTNTYAVPVLSGKSPATDKAMSVAEDWLAMLAAGNYKIDDREESAPEERVVSAQPEVFGAEVVGSPNGEY